MRKKNFAHEEDWETITITCEKFINMSFGDARCTLVRNTFEYIRQKTEDLKVVEEHCYILSYGYISRYLVLICLVSKYAVVTKITYSQSMP